MEVCGIYLLCEEYIVVLDFAQRELISKETENIKASI
jgi:hypothetical protein